MLFAVHLYCRRVWFRVTPINSSSKYYSFASTLLCIAFRIGVIIIHIFLPVGVYSNNIHFFATLYTSFHIQHSRIIEIRIQPTTPNPTTTQPTDAPVTQAPVTSSPVTPSPVTNEPTTNSPVQEGMGYCSNNGAMSCSTDSDCGCSASAASDQPWLRRSLRMLAKPRCSDGTYRKLCSDCTCADLECVGDPSCATPTTLSPTTSNPTVSPSATPTGVELTPGPSGSPVTNTPTTSQVSSQMIMCITV